MYKTNITTYKNLKASGPRDCAERASINPSPCTVDHLKIKIMTCSSFINQ